MSAGEWISIVAIVATLVIGVLGWLLSRVVSNNDDDITKLGDALKEEIGKRDTLRESFEEKLEAAKKAFEDKLERFYDKVGARIDDIPNDRPPSFHDINVADHQNREALDRLRDKFENALKELERTVYDFKGYVSGNFVNKQDFIRESTLLEQRILATKRTIEGLDDTLKSYVNHPAR
jgi:hypothetical protein